MHEWLHLHFCERGLEVTQPQRSGVVISSVFSFSLIRELHHEVLNIATV